MEQHQQPTCNGEGKKKMTSALWTTVGCWEALAGNAARLERILRTLFISALFQGIHRS